MVPIGLALGAAAAMGEPTSSGQIPSTTTVLVRPAPFLSPSIHLRDPAELCSLRPRPSRGSVCLDSCPGSENSWNMTNSTPAPVTSMICHCNQGIVAVSSDMKMAHTFRMRMEVDMFSEQIALLSRRGLTKPKPFLDWALPWISPSYLRNPRQEGRVLTFQPPAKERITSLSLMLKPRLLNRRRTHQLSRRILVLASLTGPRFRTRPTRFLMVPGLKRSLQQQAILTLACSPPTNKYIHQVLWRPSVAPKST